MDTVYYIFHLERTAGTSLRHILFEHYGWWTDLVYPYYYDWQGIVRPTPFVMDEVVNRAKFFIGHSVYYGMHEVVNKPYHYIAILRDPVDRFESWFNHNRVHNARMGQPVVDFRTWFGWKKNETQMWGLLRKSPFEKVREYNLDDAKEVLDQCSFIGLQETFEEDVLQLVGKEYHHRINTTEELMEAGKIEAVQFTPEEASEVREAMNGDYELYNYAVELRANGKNKGFHFPAV